jgi:hypothetical protein
VKIGIDVSQLSYQGTGVANYLENLVLNLLKIDQKNEYILFYSSLRGQIQKFKIKIQKLNLKVKIKEYKFPSTALDYIWNKMHFLPIEWLIGDVDLFITSDWTEPPVVKAKKATILYDLIVYKYPQETARKIVEVQKRKLEWVKKESDLFFCISEATRKDAKEILGIEDKKIKVIYPGV